MRVIVTHDVADDLGALAIGAAGNEAALVAGEKDAPVNRFQTVTHIWQGAADDHAHRVIEIAGLHFIDDVDAGVFFTAGGGGIQNFNIVGQNVFPYCQRLYVLGVQSLGERVGERHSRREPKPGFERFFHIWVLQARMVTMNGEPDRHSIPIQPTFRRRICNESPHAACAAKPNLNRRRGAQPPIHSWEFII